MPRTEVGIMDPQWSVEMAKKYFFMPTLSLDISWSNMRVKKIVIIDPQWSEEMVKKYFFTPRLKTSRLELPILSCSMLKKPNFRSQEDVVIEPEQFMEAVKKRLYMPPPMLCNNILEKRKFKIFLYKSGPNDHHHIIVLSDGVDQDITIEFCSSKTHKVASLTAKPIFSFIGKYVPGFSKVENELQFLTKASLKSENFLGDKSQCIEKGTVESTLHELMAIAVKIYNENPEYHVISNNSHHFCEKFLQETVSRSKLS